MKTLVGEKSKQGAAGLRRRLSRWQGWMMEWVMLDGGVALGRPRTTTVRGVPSLICFSIIAVAAAAAKSLQSCPTLCDLIDISPRGSPIPGILQARTLEWVAISFSKAAK